MKCGIDLAALTLKAGCNDLSGTLMEESITAQAGGDSGEFIPVDVFEDKAREMGRVAVERTTLYKKLYGKKAPNGARPIANPPTSRQITTLAGGVGAAKFIRGLVRRIEPARLTVVVNTGDDETFYGLHVSPDIDTVTYTLAGAVNRAQGWGLAGESVQRTAGARALLRQAVVRAWRSRPRHSSISHRADAPGRIAKSNHRGNRGRVRGQVARSSR